MPAARPRPRTEDTPHIRSLRLPERGAVGLIIGNPLRFVTFDRGGRRRLGALLGDRVVDLPALLGHPAFPAEMEGLVRRNGGSVLAAAEAAMAREDAETFVVEDARLVVPIVPASLRSPDATDVERGLLGPDSTIPWPRGAGWLELRPKLVAVLRRPLDGGPGEDVPGAVFGYALLADLRAVDDRGDPASVEAVPVVMGPWLATPDGFDPKAVVLRIRVDGVERSAESLNGASGRLLRDVEAAARLMPLVAGDAFASAPLSRDEERIWPGAAIELEMEGLGTLRVRVGRAA